MDLEPKLSHPVLGAADKILQFTSPVNSESVYVFQNGQPYHSPETTYQAMLATPDGNKWRAIRIENDCGGGIKTTHYEFCTNTEWSNGVKRITLDLGFKNIAVETVTVNEEGKIIITDIFRTGDASYVSNLMSLTGLDSAQVTGKSEEDVIFTSPERQQMCNLGDPNFTFVEKLKELPKNHNTLGAKILARLGIVK